MTGPAPSPPWTPTTKRMVAVALVIAGVYIVSLARGVVTIVALAAVLAFLLSPAVRFLHLRLRFPKALALATTYLLVAIGLAVIGLVVTNGVINSISDIDPPAAADSLRATAIDVLEGLEEITLFGYEINLAEVVNPLRDRLRGGEGLGEIIDDPTGVGGVGGVDGGVGGDVVVDAPDDDRTIILGRDNFFLIAGTAANSLRTLGGVVLAIVLSALVTALIALYLNLDSHRYHRAVRRYVPEAYEPDLDQLGAEITAIWHGYMYGQLINSAVTGFLVYVALAVLGVPGAFVLGVIMALLNMIPTFGPIFAAVPGVLAAFALGSTRLDVSNLAFTIIVVIVYLIVVQVQANVMAPFITGRAVKMTPAAILIGLVVGVSAAGLIGALLVVPVMATGKAIIRYALDKLTDQPPFAHLDEADESDGSDEFAGVAGADEGAAAAETDEGLSNP